jgi:transposase InsO family protein
MSESLRPRASRPGAAPKQPPETTAQPVTPAPDLELAPAATDAEVADAEEAVESASRPPTPSRHGKLLVPADQARRADFSPQQRLLILDAWLRSGLPARDFAPLVGLSRHTLYAWKQRFDQLGPAGLVAQPRGGPSGSRLPELTKRTILLLKQSHPDWGCQKISDMLLRGPALPASPGAVARVLAEAGYTSEDNPAPGPHDPPVRHFERARPNQLWQSDLFTFILKRQNRRVYLVAFMDDHSRFITGYGLHASQSSALVLETLRAALTSYGCPEEILTDNGSQYVTWRGKSAFSRELDKRGIKQVVARPRHPQTLGKIERFWGSLWRECLETAVFLDLADAVRRIGLYIDHHNFQRPHQGIGGLVPADRYFGAADEVRRALQARVAANALELARNGLPRQPFYMAGQVGGQGFSLHAEGERVILTDAAGQRKEVELVPPSPRPVLPDAVAPAAALEPLEDAERGPGESALDEALEQLRQGGMRPAEGGES